MPWFPQMLDEVLPVLPVPPAVTALCWVRLQTQTFGSSAAALWLPSSGAHAHVLPAKLCMSSLASSAQPLPIIFFSWKEKGRGWSSHPEIGSCSITHYLEDLPALPFQWLSRCSWISYSVSACTCQTPISQDRHTPTELSEAHPAPLLQPGGAWHWEQEEPGTWSQPAAAEPPPADGSAQAAISAAFPRTPAPSCFWGCCSKKGQIYPHRRKCCF